MGAGAGAAYDEAPDPLTLSRSVSCARVPTRTRIPPIPTQSPRSAASSACGLPARTSPTSPTTASTPCSTAARRRRASPCPTGGAPSSTRTSAWSARSSTSRCCRSLQGHIAVGHCRYSTTGSTTWENAQPTFRTTAAGSGIALGHNGNLVNTAELRDEVAALEPPRRHGREHRLRPRHRAARRHGRRHRRRGGGDAAAARGCAGPSRWSSPTRPPSTPPAIRTACARSSSAGSSAAG